MLVRKQILFCFFVLFSGLGFAQTFSPVANAAAWQQKISSGSKLISSIQCNFIQEKSMSMLANKSISKGIFYYKAANKVRLEYQQPVKNVIIMNEGKMTIKDEKQTRQTDMNRSKIFQQLNKIIVGSITGSLFTGIEFSFAFFENKQQLQVELVPKSKTLRSFLSKIVLVLDKKNFTAQSISMIEPSGDNTLLTFSEKTLNATLPDTLFATK